MIATAESHTSIRTKSVQLNAKDPKALAAFYENTLGFNRMQATENHFILGTPDDKKLLEIYGTHLPINDQTTGLYHSAFLLPTYKDLGTVLRHLLVHQIPLTGASNHGYSDALYLNDPEGNGIEIYWDKPASEWDVRPDGSIIGITEPMDAEAALAVASPSFSGLPQGTTVGHVHLHVDDLEKALVFYTEVMGLGLKYRVGSSALFLASGNYHHHLGANTWKPGPLAKPNRLAPGLRTVDWSGTKEDLQFIEQKLIEKNLHYNAQHNVLVFQDSAGIEHSVSIE